jgi:RimJ/RimL family protein N-acetyltransferase
MQNPYLIGSTTYLRPFHKEDAISLVGWFNDAEVTRFLTWYRPMSLEQEEKFLEKLQANEMDFALGIVTRDGDRLIGTCGLRNVDTRSRHAEFGISIGEKDYWGKGHGGEATRLIVDHAFATLNLNRVWLGVVEFNERGIKAYEKAGFRVEGRLRQHTYRDGRYWDELLMGVVRADWEERRRGG